MRVCMVRRGLLVHRIRSAETKWNAERVSRTGIPLAGAPREPCKRRHSRSRPAKVQNGKKEITRGAAIHDSAGGRRTRSTTDGKHGDCHDIAKRKRTKNQKTERRHTKESAKKTTEVQSKDHSPIRLSRNMGPKRTEKANQTRYDGRHGQDSDQAGLAKPSSTTEGNPWSTWEGAWWWKKSLNELYRLMQKIDQRQA